MPILQNILNILSLKLERYRKTDSLKMFSKKTDFYNILTFKTSLSKRITDMVTLSTDGFAYIFSNTREWELCYF